VEFGSGYGVRLWMSEFEELYPAIRKVNQADTEEERQRLLSYIDDHLDWDEYQESRVEAMFKKMQSTTQSLEDSHLKEVRNNNGFTREANVLAWIFLVLALAVTIAVGSSNGANGLLSAAICLVVYRFAFVFCGSCKKFNFKPQTLMRKEVVGQRFGTHIENLSIQTSSQNYDSRGKYSGDSYSTTYVPVEREHLDEISEYVRACNYCGHVWSHLKSKRYNL
jgi:ABC-type multidrug transport system fused ATPase/permease subunit